MKARALRPAKTLSRKGEVVEEEREKVSYRHEQCEPRSTDES